MTFIYNNIQDWQVTNAIAKQRTKNADSHANVMAACGLSEYKLYILCFTAQITEVFRTDVTQNKPVRKREQYFAVSMS